MQCIIKADIRAAATIAAGGIHCACQVCMTSCLSGCHLSLLIECQSMHGEKCVHTMQVHVVRHCLVKQPLHIAQHSAHLLLLHVFVTLLGPSSSGRGTWLTSCICLCKGVLNGFGDAVSDLVLDRGVRGVMTLTGDTFCMQQATCAVQRVSLVQAGSWGWHLGSVPSHGMHAC